jgi:hypothetical protein
MEDDYVSHPGVGIYVAEELAQSEYSASGSAKANHEEVRLAGLRHIAIVRPRGTAIVSHGRNLEPRVFGRFSQ